MANIDYYANQYNESKKKLPMSDNTILTSTNDTSLPSWICSLIADKLRTLHYNTIPFYTNPNFLAFELFKTENRNCSFCNNIDEARKWNSDYATNLADCGMYNTPSNVQFADPIHKPEEYGRKEKNNENHNQKTIHPL